MWCWRRMKISWVGCVRKEEELHRVKEERNRLKIKWRKGTWVVSCIGNAFYSVGQNNLRKFKVNTKKTIRDTKGLFLDSETTTWEVLNHIVLERISCKWWPLFAWCLRAERLGDCKTDCLTASMSSGVRELRGRPHLFSDTLPVSLKFSTHNRMDFRSGTRSRGWIW